MTTTAFQHCAAEFGCFEYLLLEEIRHCLGLRGGVNHDGHHWVYKSAQELAGIFGRARNTVAKALRHLVAMGALERQQLGVAVGHHTNRAWYYRLADGAPDWMKGVRNGTRKTEAVHCARPAQSNISSTSPRIHIKAQQRQQPAIQQPNSLDGGKRSAPPGTPVPGASEGLQKAIAAINSQEQPVKDADGFLVRPAPEAAPDPAEPPALQDPSQSETMEYAYRLSDKTIAARQELREQHPDATDEQIDDLLMEQICKQLEEDERRAAEKAARLDPVAADLSRSSQRRGRSKGFA